MYDVYVARERFPNQLVLRLCVRLKCYMLYVLCLSRTVANLSLGFSELNVLCAGLGEHSSQAVLTPVPYKSTLVLQA